MKHEAAVLPKLLEKILHWWVESNRLKLASSQGPRENGYFFFEVELVGGNIQVAIMIIFSRTNLGRQSVIIWVEI